MTTCQTKSKHDRSLSDMSQLSFLLFYFLSTLSPTLFRLFELFLFVRLITRPLHPSLFPPHSPSLCIFILIHSCICLYLPPSNHSLTSASTLPSLIPHYPFYVHTHSNSHHSTFTMDHNHGAMQSTPWNMNLDYAINWSIALGVPVVLLSVRHLVLSISRAIENRKHRRQGHASLATVDSTEAETDDLGADIPTRYSLVLFPPFPQLTISSRSFCIQSQSSPPTSLLPHNARCSTITPVRFS